MQPTVKLTKEILESPEKLTHFYDIWEIASMDFDEAAFTNLLSKTFMFVDPKGKPWKWAEIRDFIKKEKPNIESKVQRDYTVLNYSDHTVLKRCIAKIKGSFLGRTLDGNYRWSNLFIREDGDWRLCYYQLTKVPDRKQPPGRTAAGPGAEQAGKRKES